MNPLVLAAHVFSIVAGIGLAALEIILIDRYVPESRQIIAFSVAVAIPILIIAGIIVFG